VLGFRGLLFFRGIDTAKKQQGHNEQTYYPGEGHTDQFKAFVKYQLLLCELNAKPWRGTLLSFEDYVV